MLSLRKKFQGYTKKDYLKFAYHIMLVFLGSVLLAFGTATFLIPNDIVTGGVSGIAIVLQQLCFAKSGKNYVDIMVIAINVILFIIGMIFLGKKFSAQTLLSILIYSLALPLFVRVIKPERWFYFGDGETVTDFDNFLAAISGSVFVGLGCAVTFKGGGSTGGTDVLAFIGQKYLKIKCSIVSFTIDAIVIAAGYIVYKNLAACVTGIIGAFVCALMIEKVFIGYSSTYMATIISSKYEEINEFIIEKLERGSTIIEAEGGYSKETRKMLQVAFDRKEYTSLLESIHKIDPEAFVTVVLTHDVNGNGFNPFPKN